MNSSITSKSFSFNEKFNSVGIAELYGDEYPYIEEVFGTVLKEYEILVTNIQSQYDSGNIPGLRAAVHRIKPVFGFVGLGGIQQQCQEFEDVCGTSTSINSMAALFNSLHQHLTTGLALIVEEKKKLEKFNGQP